MHPPNEVTTSAFAFITAIAAFTLLYWWLWELASKGVTKWRGMIEKRRAQESSKENR